MKVAAVGRTRWLYDTVLAVAAAGHEVVLVGTCPAAPEYSVDTGDFARLAAGLGADYFCDTAINRPERLAAAERSGAEVAISVNWPSLIGGRFLGAFEHGVINAHAGDLPRFRGNATPSWAILAGENEVVLSLHRMTTELDAGPVLLQRSFPLTERTYVGDVHAFLGDALPTMFVEVLDALADGRAVPRAQPLDPSVSLRCFPRLPRDGEIDWSRRAEELSRLVRASAEPFAGAYSFVGPSRLVVWRARSGRLPYPYLGVPGQVAERNPEHGEVAVLTGDGVLVLEEVEWPPGTRGRATDLLRSTRTRLGLDVAGELARLAERVEQLEQRLDPAATEEAPGP